MTGTNTMKKKGRKQAGAGIPEVKLGGKDMLGALPVGAGKAKKKTRKK